MIGEVSMSKYISNLKLTPQQVFMLWEALNSTWFVNDKKAQLQLLRIIRRELLSMGSCDENHQMIEKTDNVLYGEWMDKREEYMDKGLTQKGFYAVKNNKREEMGI